MPPQERLLQSSSGILPDVDQPEPIKLDLDVVVILSALLCTLICVVGLALAARCAWIRNTFTADGGAPPLNKGIKKKALRTLPKISFDGAVDAGGRLAECPICLAEFVQGDEIRILPQCGPGFHVRCVDTGLRSNSSCPFCRQILFLAPLSRWQQCDRSSTSGEEPRASGEVPTAVRADYASDSFLP